MDWRLKSLAPILNLGERFGPVANVVENSPEVNPVGFWSPLRIWALVWRTLPQYPNIQIRSYLQRSGDSCTPAANGALENPCGAQHRTADIPSCLREYGIKVGLDRPVASCTATPSQDLERLSRDS